MQPATGRKRNLGSKVPKYFCCICVVFVLLQIAEKLSFFFRVSCCFLQMS